MNKLMSAIFILLLAVVAGAQSEIPPIRNFVRVNDQFCTGGQPRLEHLQQLKSDGVKAIINLRPTSEHRAAEEESRAKELGLRYFNIPVVFGEPKEEQATEFLRITDDAENRPAFIHCASAIRVGAFWMIRRVLRDDWTIEAAEEEAKKIGLRESPHLNQFARSYIARHQDKTPSTERELIELERELSDALIKGTRRGLPTCGAMILSLPFLMAKFPLRLNASLVQNPLRNRLRQLPKRTQTMKSKCISR